MTQEHEAFFRQLLIDGWAAYETKALDSEDFEDKLFYRFISGIYSDLYVAFMHEDAAKRM